jgi:hypothetical protein
MQARMILDIFSRKSREKRRIRINKNKNKKVKKKKPSLVRELIN